MTGCNCATVPQLQHSQVRQFTNNYLKLILILLNENIDSTKFLEILITIFSLLQLNASDVKFN